MRDCKILELLGDQPNNFFTVVAEHHGLNVHCASGELICERSIQRIELVIGNLDKIGSSTRTMDGG